MFWIAFSVYTGIFMPVNIITSIWSNRPSVNKRVYAVFHQKKTKKQLRCFIAKKKNIPLINKKKMLSQKTCTAYVSVLY